MRTTGRFLLLLVFLSAAGVHSDEPAKKKSVPVSGETSPRFARLDEVMTSFLDRYDFPGAALAVGKEGKILHARAYGYADRDTRQVLKPDALFRISSTSKPLTAAAVLQLVERGRLKLDDRVFDVLGLRAPTKGFDDRWKQITIRQLLEHRGGWDASKSRDPMFISPVIVKEMGGPHPAMPATIIRYMLRQPLDFDPGERFAYSNFGYCLLGRVIEKVGKQSYEAHVRKNVLEPLGIRRMRLGRSFLMFRAPGEVKYHSREKYPALWGPQFGRQVPIPYGGFCLEAMDAHAGWLGSAADLVRFALAFDDPGRCPLLRAETVETMFARPEGEDPKKVIYYAKGWMVGSPGMGLRAYWHDGALEGSGAMLARRVDGVAFALLLNSREKCDGKEPIAILDGLIHQAIEQAFRGR